MSLTKEYQQKLVHIKNTARNLWKKHNLSHYFFTPHDTSHSEGVIRCINKLVPDPLKNLTQNEYFLLLASAWLHDIGMIPGICDDDPEIITKEYYLKIREKHHIRSKNYIIENSGLLGITADEAKIIGLLSKFHRRREDINNLKDTYNVRVQLLAAYLRIADAIHIDSSRVDIYENLYNLFLAESIPLSSEFHWLRSFWIRDIEAKPVEATLTVHFNFSKDEKINGLQVLIDNTLDDLREELDSCKNVLIKAGISYYVEIDYKATIEANDRELAKLKQVISKLESRHTASSSQLADIMIDTVSYIISEHGGRASDKVALISKYQNSEIAQVKKDRPCHVLMKHIDAVISSTLSDHSTDEQTKLDIIKRKLENLCRHREETLRKITENAQPFLKDCSPILLFGYSSIVISALGAIADSVKEKTEVYVLECRNKNQLNYRNDMLFCDGLRYALDLSNRGFKKVSLVPDVIVGNLITNKFIKKVFFGANTVDIEKNIIGHTAGHSTIIHVAREYNIPIYIFVDSFKFGELEDDTKDERTTHWFVGNKFKRKELVEKGIKFYNPRSDIIPLEYVYMFITDEGNFPPSQIPTSLRDRIDEIKRMTSSS